MTSTGMKRFKVVYVDLQDNRRSLETYAYDGAHAAKLVQEELPTVEVDWCGQVPDPATNRISRGQLASQLKKSIERARQRRLWR